LPGRAVFFHRSILPRASRICLPHIPPPRDRIADIEDFFHGYPFFPHPRRSAGTISFWRYPDAFSDTLLPKVRAGRAYGIQNRIANPNTHPTPPSEALPTGEWRLIPHTGRKELPCPPHNPSAS